LWQQTLLLFEKCYWLKALCALQIGIDPCNWPLFMSRPMHGNSSPQMVELWR
jgi:hypothetical protein